MTLNEKGLLFLATGAYTGKIPFAPGTFGTLAGIPFVFLFSILPLYACGPYISCLILAATWISDRAEKIIGKKDPGCIVIDEIAGFTVAMSVLPLSMMSLGIGFLVFRFFDIAKPFPTKWFENNIKGGAGIVLDDIVAGIYSAIVLRIIYFFHIF